MSDTLRDYPAIMHDATTTIPVLVPAFDYADAIKVADQVTAPGQLWDGFQVIVLASDDGSDQCEECGWERRHCICH